jgi:hypothetical protein
MAAPLPLLVVSTNSVAVRASRVTGNGLELILLNSANAASAITPARGLSLGLNTGIAPRMLWPASLPLFVCTSPRYCSTAATQQNNTGCLIHQQQTHTSPHLTSPRLRFKSHISLYLTSHFSHISHITSPVSTSRKDYNTSGGQR